MQPLLKKPYYLIIINYSLHGNISTSNFEFNGGKCNPRVYKQIFKFLTDYKDL